MTHDSIIHLYNYFLYKRDGKFLEPASSIQSFYDNYDSREFVRKYAKVTSKVYSDYMRIHLSEVREANGIPHPKEKRFLK